MRISDWSSDVCSSDLEIDADGNPTSPFGFGGGGGGARSGGFRPGGAQFDFGGEAGDIGDIFEGLFGQRQQGGGGGFSSGFGRSEEHTSELQSLMRISSAVFCLEKNK